MAHFSYASANDSPSGGASAYRNIDAGVTGDVVKASPGRLYGWHVSNAAAASAYVKIYDKATAPTEADTPVLTIAVPATGVAFMDLGPGVGFASGISIRATTGAADNDTGAPAANDVIANLLYR
jgi:hypothetical protein